MSRTFNLPSHYRLKLKVIITSMAWEIWREKAYLRLDDKPLWEASLAPSEGYYNWICGGTQERKDSFKQIEVEADHTGATAAISITTSLDGHPN